MATAGGSLAMWDGNETTDSDGDNDQDVPFYANPNAPHDKVHRTRPQRIPGTALLFAAAAGTIPPFSPLNIGQEAINQQTNESWFVNQGFQWQQQIGV